MFYRHIIISSHHRTCHNLFPLIKSTSGMSVTTFIFSVFSLNLPVLNVIQPSNHHVTSVTSLIFYVISTSLPVVQVLQPSFSASSQHINQCDSLHFLRLLIKSTSFTSVTSSYSLNLILNSIFSFSETCGVKLFIYQISYTVQYPSFDSVVIMLCTCRKIK